MHKESHNLRHHEYMEGGVGKAARDTPRLQTGHTQHPLLSGGT